MPLFLSPDDLADLTGRKRPGDQLEALRGMGIRHVVNAAGRPVVAVAEVERVMVGGTGRVAKSPEPDLSWVYGPQAPA